MWPIKPVKFTMFNFSLYFNIMTHTPYIMKTTRNIVTIIIKMMVMMEVMMMIRIILQNLYMKETSNAGFKFHDPKLIKSD